MTPATNTPVCQVNSLIVHKANYAAHKGTVMLIWGCTFIQVLAQMQPALRFCSRTGSFRARRLPAAPRSQARPLEKELPVMAGLPRASHSTTVSFLQNSFYCCEAICYIC